MITLFNWLPDLMDTFTFYGGGGGKGGGKKQTSTQTSAPWTGLQPYLTDYLKRGQETTQRPYNFYNGDTVAGFAPEQELGFNLGTQRALSGSPTLNAANKNITGTLNGDYLSPNSNPYLRQNVDQAMGDVQTRVNSQFNNNNFGSSAHQELLTRNLGDVANNMYGQNYSNERSNQLSAAGQAPGLANADYLDPQVLQGIGSQRQGLANQYLGNASEQFDGAAEFPYKQLERYGKVVNNGSGQGGTTTTQAPNPNQSNGFTSLLGAGLTAASLFKPLGGFRLSDARLKSNIERVGTHKTGVGVYEYDKFGKRERGVMAQEVEKVMPEAVSTHPSGFKQVAYGLLGD